MQGRHILVVDDELKIRAVLRDCFEGEGAHVSEAADLAGVLRVLKDTAPDLVTLDLNLGRENGFEIARELRRNSDIPIIIVTGKNDVIDKVVGLELGADDFVTKPFHLREVIARAKAVLRRYTTGKSDAAVSEGDEAAAGGSALALDGMCIDLDRMWMQGRDGAEVALTTADFKLLRAFIENTARPLSRDVLMDLIDGPDWTPLDRTIDNQVARLRKKIERDPANPKLIKTVRGIGYMMTMAAQSRG